MAKSKKGAKQATPDLTPEQKARREAAKAKKQQQALERAEQQRLAQIVNLHISGYSLAEIGTAIGASADEVDKMITTQATRYIRTQPALRAYVRNFVSGKYMELLEPVLPMAKDATHPLMFEAQDRALKIVNNMAKLHGAIAPEQKEVTVEASPAAVEAMVAALAAQQGKAYDAHIFDDDVFDADVVEDAVEQSAKALEVSGNQIDEGDDPL